MIPSLISAIPRSAAFYGATLKTPTVQNLIGGNFENSSSKDFSNVVDPLTQEVMQQTPQSTDSEMLAAVESAKEAFQQWKDTPLMSRVRLMLDFQAALKENQNLLAEVLAREHGKTFPDAQGSIMRGIEIVEWACSAPQVLKGEYLQNITRDFDSFQYRAPIGVTSAVCRTYHLYFIDFSFQLSWNDSSLDSPYFRCFWKLNDCQAL